MRRRGEDSTTFLDFLFLMVLVMLLLVNPKVPATKSDVPPPGNLVVTVSWPDGGEQDIDLWAWSDGEARPVGFSNRSGKYWSLLRDDLGQRNDTLKANIENAYSRDIPRGRTTVNLFCYTCREVPVPVSVEIILVTNGTTRRLVETRVVLRRHGQEITVVSFELDDTGALVPNSANNVFVPLYKDWKR